MKKPDLLGALKPVIDAFDRLAIPYYAETLGVHDLWQRACSESGLKP
jgi:hypothetical protein